MKAEVEELIDQGDEFVLTEDTTFPTIQFTLTSRTMLLMNSSAGVNPLNALVKQKGILTSKRPKSRSDEDIYEIYRLDFWLGMYFDEELGPYIPGVNIEAALLLAAMQEKMGPKFKSGVTVVEDRLKLEYKGPRTLRELWDNKEGKFVDIRPTKLKASSSLMKCRPCFPQWILRGTASFNPAIVNRDEVVRCLKKVGPIGLCDYRKRYGKSIVTIEGE